MSTTEMLLRLGITANYKGFLYLISAVEMCLADEECLHLVTKQVYPQVARQYKTNWRAVERNMRKAGEIAWLRQQAYLEELARGPLKQRPSNAQLLAILTMARPPGRGNGRRGEGRAEGKTPPAVWTAGGVCGFGDGTYRAWGPAMRSFSRGQS